MNDSSSTFNPWPVALVVLCSDEALATGYLQDVCGPEAKGHVHETVLNGKTVSLRVLAGHPSTFPEWERDVRMADGLILLTRFLDRDSLDEVRQLFSRMPTHGKQPLSVLYVRNEGEHEFKMSCPVCAQKLWVRDLEAGHTGRCPTCQRTFKTPSQAELLSNQLMLLADISVVKVVHRNASSCRGPLLGLVERIQAMNSDPAESGPETASEPLPVVISAAETAQLGSVDTPPPAKVPAPVLVPSEPVEAVEEAEYTPLPAVPLMDPPTQRATVEEVAASTGPTPVLKKKSAGATQMRIKPGPRKKIMIQVKKKPPAEES